MSRLITTNPDRCQDPEPEGQEYGYCVFQKLLKVSMIKKVLPTTNVTLNEILVSLADSVTDFRLNITHERLCQFQQEDPFCKRIMGLLRTSKLKTNNPYYMEDKM